MLAPHWLKRSLRNSGTAVGVQCERSSTLGLPDYHTFGSTTSLSSLGFKRPCRFAIFALALPGPMAAVHGTFAIATVWLHSNTIFTLWDLICLQYKTVVATLHQMPRLMQPRTLTSWNPMPLPSTSSKALPIAFGQWVWVPKGVSRPQFFSGPLRAVFVQIFSINAGEWVPRWILGRLFFDLPALFAAQPHLFRSFCIHVETHPFSNFQLPFHDFSWLSATFIFSGLACPSWPFIWCRSQHRCYGAATPRHVAPSPCCWPRFWWRWISAWESNQHQQFTVFASSDMIYDPYLSQIINHIIDFIWLQSKS